MKKYLYLLLASVLFLPVMAFAASCQSVNSFSTNPPASSTIKIRNDQTQAGTASTSGGTNPVRFGVDAQPSNGTVTINSSNGNWIYTPTAGYVGSDSFTLMAYPSCNSDKAKTITFTTKVSATAVTCNPPVLAAIADAQTYPDVPVNGNAVASGGTPPYYYSINVLTTKPGAGSVSVNSATGAYTYTPGATYSGLFNFEVHVSSSCNITATDVSVPAEVIIVKHNTPACAAPVLPATASFITTTNTAFQTNAAVTSASLPAQWMQNTAPAHGVLAVDATSGTLTYTPATNYLGADSFSIKVGSDLCGWSVTTFTVDVKSTSYTTGTYQSAPTKGNIISGGGVIIDNTTNPGTAGLKGNMGATIGGSNYNISNAFNIDSIQILQRDITVTPHALVDEAGVNNKNSTSFNNYGTATQLNYFANGQHLFDLKRLIAAANWMSANVTPDYNASCTLQSLPRPSGVAIHTSTSGYHCHPAGTYGTISWAQFLDNIKNSRTMWGIVHVKIPLELGTAKGSNNALDVSIGTANIYGFCASTTGLCANAPTSNTELKPGAISGHLTTPVTIPSGAIIRVRGALFLDFVNAYADKVSPVEGTSIGFDHLPYQAKDIYFKTTLPLNVNASNDKNDDGVMDNIDYISNQTAGINCPGYPCTTVVPNATVFSTGQVPQESIDSYNHNYSKTWTDNTDPAFITAFNLMNTPNKYHMLMPTGYEQGWADAFAELGITAGQWADLGFLVPASASLILPLTINDIRDPAFEDLPVYLVNGGLLDMSHPINLSGLIYIPQAIEIEQEMSSTRQYISGALITRDGFSIEGTNAGITLISSNPAALASLRVNSQSVTGAMLTAAKTSMHATNSVQSAAAIGGVGVSSSSSQQTQDIVGSTNSGTSIARSRFIEIKAQ